MLILLLSGCSSSRRGWAGPEPGCSGNLLLLTAILTLTWVTWVMKDRPWSSRPRYPPATGDQVEGGPTGSQHLAAYLHETLFFANDSAHQNFGAVLASLLIIGGGLGHRSYRQMRDGLKGCWCEVRLTMKEWNGRASPVRPSDHFTSPAR